MYVCKYLIAESFFLSSFQSLWGQPFVAGDGTINTPMA